MLRFCLLVAASLMSTYAGAATKYLFCENGKTWGSVLGSSKTQTNALVIAEEDILAIEITGVGTGQTDDIRNVSGMTVAGQLPFQPVSDKIPENPSFTLNRFSGELYVFSGENEPVLFSGFCEPREPML